MIGQIDFKGELFDSLMGMIVGAFGEALQEMAKELRRSAGGGYHAALDALEAKAVRSVENAAIDGIPEHEQVFLIEQTRHVIRAVFEDARRAT